MTGPTTTKTRRSSITALDYSSSTANETRVTVIGVPTEVKPQENRVGLSPSAAAEYVKDGHKVIIQKSAGEGSRFPDEMYIKAGCEIVPCAADVFRMASMIIKIKEIQPCEYDYIRRGMVIFTYFHFAASHDLTSKMIEKGAVCVAYETVRGLSGGLPLLTPMSEIAGKMAVHEGAKYLETPMGGSGILLGGLPGVKRGKVLVLGGGVVGAAAASVAAGMGADVVVLDVNINRLRQLSEILPANCRTLFSSTDNIKEELKDADLVIGAVLIPGSVAPRLICRDYLKTMKKGSVIIDVAVDQGGCVETCHPTTHENPTYVVDGVLHYCVGNMPGAVPQTATTSLNNSTLQYGLQLANKGWRKACFDNKELKSGLSIVEGKVVCKAVADTFDLPYHDVDTVLGMNFEQKCLLEGITADHSVVKSTTLLTAGN